MARAKSKQVKDRKRAAVHQYREQQRAAKKAILSASINDDEFGKEIDCNSTTNDIQEELKKQFEGVSLGAVPKVEPGLVLYDPYGDGAFQDLLWLENSVE